MGFVPEFFLKRGRSQIGDGNQKRLSGVETTGPQEYRAINPPGYLADSERT